jgi:hypothetical protein
MYMFLVLLVPPCSISHTDNRRPVGRMRPSTSLDPALIHFNELPHEDEIQQIRNSDKDNGRKPRKFYAAILK